MAQSTLSFLSSLSLVVRAEDGSVDLDATAAKVREDLRMELESVRETDSSIEAALDDLFNSRPDGKGVPTDFAASQVAMRLGGGDFDAVLAFTASVHDYLKRSTRFEARRGRNGGLFRVA